MESTTFLKPEQKKNLPWWAGLLAQCDQCDKIKGLTAFDDVKASCVEKKGTYKCECGNEIEVRSNEHIKRNH